MLYAYIVYRSTQPLRIFKTFPCPCRRKYHNILFNAFSEGKTYCVRFSDPVQQA